MRQALVPRNLNMSLFGNKADKVAMILNCIYRLKTYKDDYGHVRHRCDFTKPVALNMARLRETLCENPAPVMDMICRSKRHEENGTHPIEVVIERVRPAKRGEQSAQYRFVAQYQIKPKLHRIKRTSLPVFNRNKSREAAMIAGWPEPYQKVCKHIRTLTLEMNEQQLEDLIQQIRSKYIQADRKKFVEAKIDALLKRHPNMSEVDAEANAIASWEEVSEKRIDELDEDHYDSQLFIRDKFFEMQGEDEFPIYSLDEQGRLHYYLTNMSEEMRPYVRLDGCKMVSYDLGTSQCVFVWITLREYIRENDITLDGIKKQANEIMETMAQYGDGTIPEYAREGFDVLKRRRSQHTLDREMKQLSILLSKDFYADIMKIIDWDRLPNGEFNRKKFKGDVRCPQETGQV